MNTLQDNLKDEYEKAKELMISSGLKIRKDYEVRFNTRLKTTLGRCYKNKPIIEINYYYFKWSMENNKYTDVFNTLVHELIHTVEGCANHGKKFKMICNYLNEKYDMDLNRLYSGEYIQINKKESEYNYEVYCVNCNMKKGYKNKRVINNINKYRCAKCNNKLKWREKDNE